MKKIIKKNDWQRRWHGNMKKMSQNFRKKMEEIFRPSRRMSVLRQ